MEELTEREKNIIAEYIQEGYTSGRFDGDNEGEAISWELKFEKWEE